MAILPVVTLTNRDRTLVTDSTIAKQITFHGIEQQTCHAERFCRSGIDFWSLSWKDLNGWK